MASFFKTVLISWIYLAKEKYSCSEKTLREDKGEEKEIVGIFKFVYTLLQCVIY